MKILLRFRNREILDRIERLREPVAKDPELMAHETNRTALIRLLLLAGCELYERRYGLRKD